MTGPKRTRRRAAQPNPSALAGNPAAEARDLRVTFGTGETAVQAVDGVSATFAVGELTAIMGPSGSGKSTLLYALAGLDRPTSGEALIGGVPLARLSERELTRLRRDRIGFVFQSFNLLPMLTARENITLPLDLAGAPVDTAWFDEVVQAVGLRSRLEHRPVELSGGQQQRVAVGRALITRPAVVFADEPTGNLDSRSGTEVLRFLRRAVDDHGQAIVMVTHDATAASYADRVIFLADGRLVDEVRRPTASGLLDRMKDLEVAVA